MLKIFYFLKRLVEINILTYKALTGSPLTRQEAGKLKKGMHIFLVEVFPFRFPIDLINDPDVKKEKYKDEYKQVGIISHVDPIEDLITIAIGTTLITLSLGSYNITWYLIRRVFRWD